MIASAAAATLTVDASSAQNAARRLFLGRGAGMLSSSAAVPSALFSPHASRLVGIISSKIKDARLIKLIWKLLKAGYCEDWQYHMTYSGTPQGGICSPIFANIYLHELDKFVVNLAKNFDKPKEKKFTPEYQKIASKLEYIRKKLIVAEDREKSELLRRRETLRKELIKSPCKSQTDKKLK